MTSTVGENTELDDLKRAIASGHLASDLQKRAQAFVEQIESPIRMSVLGLPGSGKSQLINLLAGQDILPPGVNLPAVQLSYGKTAQIDCTLADGSIVSVDSADMQAAAKQNPVFVDAKYPLPALQKLSLLEVAAGASHEEQKRAMMWAAKRTDMAIWCTEGAFGEAEEDLLLLLPDRVQDHAFLVLTKADVLNANGSLAQILGTLKSTSRDFFNAVYPLDTHSALAARGADGAVDRDLMRASGAIGLITAIRRTIDMGREAMLDQIGVFLTQIGVEPTTQVVAEPKPAKAPTKPKQKKAEAAVEPSTTLLDASREACEVAVAQLAAEGVFMTDALADGDLPPETVLDTCADTIIWLSEYLAESGAQNDLVMERTRTAAADGADLIQLIRLETGDSVSTDALSLLVQLKQEIQVALAA